MVAKRDLAAGAELTTDLLYAPLFVRKGEAVTVKATTGGITIAATMRAKASGRLGETISVEHLSGSGTTTLVSSGHDLEASRSEMNVLILALMLTAESGRRPVAVLGRRASNLFLFRDLKARNVGDILTIQVVENASATNSANTATQKKGGSSA